MYKIYCAKCLTLCKILYKKYYKYRNHSLTHSLTLTGWISSEMLKTLERDHHQVRSSNLVTFRHLLPLVRFHTTEWRHKNNRSTPLFYGCSQKELNSKNFEKIIHFPILKETQPTIFWATDVITSLNVPIFRVTLRDRTQTFV